MEIRNLGPRGLQVLFLVTGPVACAAGVVYPWVGVGYGGMTGLLWLARVRGFRTVWVPWNWYAVLPVAGSVGYGMVAGVTPGQGAAMAGLVVVAAMAWVGIRWSGLIVLGSGVVAALGGPGPAAGKAALVGFAAGIAVAVLMSQRRQPRLEDVSHLETTFGPVEVQLLSYGLKRLLAVGLARRVWR